MSLLYQSSANLTAPSTIFFASKANHSSQNSNLLPWRPTITFRLQHGSASRALTNVTHVLVYGSVIVSTLIVFPLVSRAQDSTAVTGIPAQSIATSLPQNDDAEGQRKALAARGMTYGLNYVGEWQGNVSGGVSRGSIYIGRLEGVVDIDLGKLAGRQGLTFHANGYQIHGGGLSREHIDNLMTVSYIEALATTRLSELWLEQKLLGDKLGVRFGQLAADTEFNTSAYAAQFINGTFGWPAIFANDLPSGGPAYPFATPGIRFKFDLDKRTSFLLGVFNGDPAGPDLGDPQTRNRYGTNFRVQDPALVIGEAQYRYNQDKNAPGLAGTIKLGAWGHFGRFGDQRFGTDGLSLADPASNGSPRPAQREQWRVRPDRPANLAAADRRTRQGTGCFRTGIGQSIRQEHDRSVF